MFCKERIHTITEVGNAETLAEKLIEYTWTLCTGFKSGNYLFLNDSLSVNGAQEYAIYYKNKQIESITFSWCNYERALLYIKEILDGKYDREFLCVKDYNIDENKNHTCGLCV